MKFTDDELVILMIYAEETRGKTIESIRGMIYRKMKNMKTWTSTISATHFKGGQECQGGQNILQRSHRMPQGI